MKDIYKVAFVVEGYVKEPNAPLGNLECGGIEPEKDGTFWIKDGRA